MPSGDKAAWIAFWTAYARAREAGPGAVVRLLLGRLAVALLVLGAAVGFTYLIGP
ncbi:hypothetical protein [Salinarimonas soli]|uniref:hypothetical protein n=1 Tax=Salinarimonas soli TaxID=1638099 RepID=UPI001661E1BA|nr:hypothetical protein [Salinarimonas soli]